MNWCAIPLCWQNYNTLILTLVQPVTTTRRITDVEILDAETVPLAKSVWARRRRLNRLARTRCPLNPLRLQFRHGTNSRNALHNRFHTQRQRRQSTMRHNGGYFWKTTIELRNARAFFLNSTRRLSTRAKRPSFYCETPTMVSIEFIQQMFTDKIRINFNEATFSKSL